MYVVPLTTSPNQTFTTTIPVNGKKLKVKIFLKYNTEQKCWTMNLKDEKNISVISGVPLVCGLNILEQQSYMKVGSCYIVKINPNISRSKPNEFDLGTNFLMVWGDNE